MSYNTSEFIQVAFIFAFFIIATWDPQIKKKDVDNIVDNKKV